MKRTQLGTRACLCLASVLFPGAGIALTVLTGCPGADTALGSLTNDARLVGTWTENWYGQDQPADLPGTPRMEFRADGTAVFSNFYAADTLVRYETSGNELRVETGTAWGTQVYEYAIEGDQLTLTAHGAATTFTRS